MKITRYFIIWGRHIQKYKNTQWTACHFPILLLTHHLLSRVCQPTVANEGGGKAKMLQNIYILVKMEYFSIWQACVCYLLHIYVEIQRKIFFDVFLTAKEGRRVLVEWGYLFLSLKSYIKKKIYLKNECPEIFLPEVLFSIFPQNSTNTVISWDNSIVWVYPPHPLQPTFFL